MMQVRLRHVKTNTYLYSKTAYLYPKPASLHTQQCLNRGQHHMCQCHMIDGSRQVTVFPLDSFFTCMVALESAIQGYV